MNGGLGAVLVSMGFHPIDGVHRVTKPMLNFKSFRAAKNVLAGIELMHMIRKGQLLLEGGIKLSFADQFYVLSGQIRPV